MQKAKVIKHKETGLKAFLFEKKGWAMVGIAIILFLMVATTIPLANIPGFARIASMLGLSQDSMRTLKLTDLAAYAAGVNNNRVAAAQFNQYQNGELGGLGFFSASANDGRLLNAREAYLKEYQQTGLYPNIIAGPLSMAQGDNGAQAQYGGVSVDGRALSDAPVIDAKRVEAGQYGQNFGAPVFTQAVLGEGAGGLNMNLAGKQGQTGNKMSLPTKPKGMEFSVAGSGDFLSKSIESSVGGFKMGRLGSMGGFAPLLYRVNTKGEGGQMGAFGGIGRSFIYSFNARKAGYKVAAKNIAEAAFDGSEPEAEGLIVPGEKEERYLGNLRPPSTTISRLQAGANKCAAAKQAIRGQITEVYEVSKKTYKDMLAINGGKLPGSCKNKWFAKKHYRKRAQWNGLALHVEALCKALKELEDDYAKACATTYNPQPKGGCDNIALLNLIGKPTFSGWQCSKAKNSYNKKGRLSQEAAQTLLNDAFESEVTGVSPDFGGDL